MGDEEMTQARQRQTPINRSPDVRFIIELRKNKSPGSQSPAIGNLRWRHDRWTPSIYQVTINY